MKQYIGISRDHSASMSSLTKAAIKDYNDLIASFRDAATVNNVDTVVSVVKCGHKASPIVSREIVNSSISALKPLEVYDAMAGGTPLWDSVGELINILSKVPDADDPNVAFLVTVVTDGEENRSIAWTSLRLVERIRELQATDRWTFVFRVPRGYAKAMMRLGIPEGNIMEWDQTARDMERSTVATQSAVQEYFSGRSRGVSATRTFYASMKDVDPTVLRSKLEDISKEVSIWSVGDDEHDEQIKPFVEKRLNREMEKGAAFYQLSKPESVVQDYKLICVRDRVTNAIYGGPDARDMLGLPQVGSVKVIPGGRQGQWDIFIQSTSMNRKLKKGTDLLYWPRAIR